VEWLALKPLDRMPSPLRSSQRVGGNTLPRSAPLGGRYGSGILASQNLGPQLSTGLSVASDKDSPRPEEQQSGGPGF
jgi:hypothetical protein